MVSKVLANRNKGTEPKMGHQIEQFEDGTSAFFSARELPWHKLGTVTANALTAQEAITTAQQDWLVEKRPIYTKLEDGTYLAVKDKFATVRNHPKAGYSALGVVGNQYVPVQNMEAFEILDAIRDDSGAVYETAGSLYEGKRVFISMKLPNTLKFAGGQDNVDLYILASNSHDSSTAFQLMVTPIRVVCANTLAMAVGNHKRVINLKHTRNVKSRVTEARDALGLTFAYVEEFEKQVEKLISSPMSHSEFYAYTEKLYEIKGTTQKQETRTEKVREEIKALWNAPTQANIKGTRWAAYNAVVEYVDWGMAMRLTKKISESDARAIRTMTGGADVIKNRAMKLLVK